MDFTPILTAMMGLDYNSSSIGIDFGAVAPGIKKIQIIPDGKFRAHRVTQRTLDLYTSPDNTIYTMASRSNWSFTTDSNGVITITFKEAIATRYLKVHVKFDERDSSFTAKSKATFLNDLAKMLRVYQEATSRTEEFHYYAAGNRKDQIITLIRSNTYSSSYYTNSDRLKTDGKFAFVYDEAGNLVKKGNKFNINGDTVTFTATSGDGVEYWQYTYDLLNRLTEVSKNGTVVADYEYSPDGLREVKRGSGGTIHYVFEGTEPIFEKRISDSRIRSYVYALGKHLARVDGVIGDSSAKVYYYHTDNVGSVKAVTDAAGNVVFNADYFAFGTQFTKDGEFDESHGFTGKECDSDTGLYYYNARWYDSELGRFISEDQVDDPNNPNIYVYGANNPLINTDPTGNDLASTISSIVSAIKSFFSGGGSSNNSSTNNRGNNNSNSNNNNKQEKSEDKTSTKDQNPKDTTNYIGDKPEGDPVRYVTFPSGLKLPVYNIDQLPAAIRGNYVNQIDSKDNTIIYVPQGMESEKVSEHFTVKEFMSKVAATDAIGNLLKDQNGKAYSIGKDRFIRLSPELITQLETIRASNGNNPMTIHEGYRSVLWQRALTANGEPTAKIASPHTSGIAVDFHITGKDGNRISGKAIAETISGKTEGRVGIGSNWIHYDVGDMVYGPNYGLHTKNGTIYPYQKGSTWNY